MALLAKVMLRCPFQQSAMLSVTLTLTFHSLSIPESQFSKHGGVRPSYRAKATGIADCRIPELMNSGKSSYGDWKMPESQFD